MWVPAFRGSVNEKVLEGVDAAARDVAVFRKVELTIEDAACVDEVALPPQPTQVAELAEHVGGTPPTRPYRSNLAQEVAQIHLKTLTFRLPQCSHCQTELLILRVKPSEISHNVGRTTLDLREMVASALGRSLD